MSTNLKSVAVSIARYLKKNGGHYELEISSNQRVNLSQLLAVLGEFEGCRYMTRKLGEGRFAIMRIDV